MRVFNDAQSRIVKREERHFCTQVAHAAHIARLKTKRGIRHADREVLCENTALAATDRVLGRATPHKRKRIKITNVSRLIKIKRDARTREENIADIREARADIARRRTLERQVALRRRRKFNAVRANATRRVPRNL